MSSTSVFRIPVTSLLRRPGASRNAAVEGTLADIRGPGAEVGDTEPIAVDLVLERVSEGIVVLGPIRTRWSGPAGRARGMYRLRTVGALDRSRSAGFSCRQLRVRLGREGARDQRSSWSKKPLSSASDSFTTGEGAWTWRRSRPFCTVCIVRSSTTSNAASFRST
jgi:hypothetical protein